MDKLLRRLVENRISSINTEVCEGLADINEAKSLILQKRKQERKLHRELGQLKKLLAKEQIDE